MSAAEASIETSSRQLMGETVLSMRFARGLPVILFAIGLLWQTGTTQAANFNVSSDGELRNAINSANNGDTITLTSNITLSGNLPMVTKSLTFNGGNHTLSGNSQYRGLFVLSGTVSVNNLTITKTVAQGGNGGSGWGGGGGGGAAGLGGALFIGKTASVSVSNVNLQQNTARGGSGGASTGDGGGWYAWTAGGGGGIGLSGANGGNASGVASGGGGAGLGNGTGDGGDGSLNSNGGAGGYGAGGGGSGNAYGGSGGFGGGSGGGSGATRMPGGFLGGDGGSGGKNGQTKYGGGGGGGAGLGGAIFVEPGGSLVIGGPLNVSGNASVGGAGGAGYTAGGVGAATGQGMFLGGSGSLVLQPGSGQTQTISDAIVDQTGLGGTGVNAGSWSLVKNDAGTLILTGANAYSGGTTVNSGVLQGNTAGIQRNVVNNASVVFNQDDAGTYAGNMSGTGAVTKSGSGTVTFTGTNSYSGGTNVTGGLLLGNTSDAFGTAAATIRLNGGGIGVVFANDQTFSQNVEITTTGTLYTGVNPKTWTPRANWTGTVSGTGELVVAGGGSLLLSGTNTYSGGTRINGGALVFERDANLGAAGTAININNGTIATTDNAVAAMAINRSLVLGAQGGTVIVANNPLEWSGVISGAGQFQKSGRGVLHLTGNNTYTGGTYVAQGTLQVDSDAQLGAAGASVTLNNNAGFWANQSFTTSRDFSLLIAGGTFQTETGTTLTLTGKVSGGAIGLVGTGTLVLAGTSAYNGINNYGGTVQGTTDTLRGNVFFDTNAGNTNARSLTFDQATNGTFAGNITGLGSVTKTGTGTVLLTGTNTYSAGTTITAGTLQGTTASLQGNITNNAALEFVQTINGTYAGAINGPGTLTKSGTGNVNLTGASTVGGGTTINNGGLAVNGHLTSNVTVNKDGTLSGSGNITGKIVNNGGTIKPGNSIGHLTVAGDFEFSSGTLEIEVNAQGDSDRISVVGPGNQVLITAGTLEILPDPGFYTPNTTYTIISTEAGGTVTFGDVTGGVGFLTPQVALDQNNIYVTLVLKDDAFSQAAVTANQMGVANALDAITASGNLEGLVTAMANVPVAQGPAALDALSGQPYADFATTNIRASQLFMNAVGRQMALARGVNSGASDAGSRAEICLANCERGANSGARFTTWISGIGSTGSVDGNANAGSLDYTFGGTAFGIDYRVDPRFLVGVAGGYVTGSQSVGGFAGDGDTDAYSAVAYGSFTEGAFYADALAGYSNASNDLTRYIALPGSPLGLAKGDMDASQFLAQIEAGYRYDLQTAIPTSITPFARLQVVTVDQDSFTETGLSPYNLNVSAQDATSTRSTIGADFAATTTFGNGVPLDLNLRLGWIHEFGDTARSITASFASVTGPDFTVWGATPQRDSALIGLSAAARISDASSIFVSYDGELGGGTDDHQIWGGLRITW